MHLLLYLHVVFIISMYYHSIFFTDIMICQMLLIFLYLKTITKKQKQETGNLVNTFTSLSSFPYFGSQFCLSCEADSL